MPRPFRIILGRHDPFYSLSLDGKWIRLKIPIWGNIFFARDAHRELNKMWIDVDFDLFQIMESYEETDGRKPPFDVFLGKMIEDIYAAEVTKRLSEQSTATSWIEGVEDWGEVLLLKHILIQSFNNNPS